MGHLEKNVSPGPRGVILWKPLFFNPMKLSPLLLSPLLAFLLPVSGSAEPRDWTNTDGKTITAELKSVSGDELTLTLRMDNGREYTVPLESLSAEDQDFAREWKEEQEALANAPELKTEPVLAKPGKVLYQSSLATIDEAWRQPHGDWSAGEEGLSGTERAADDHAAVMKNGSLALKDVIIEFDVLLGEGERTRAMFGIDDAKDHVCRVTLTPTSFQAQKDDNDHEGPDKGKPFNRVDEELETDEWHTVRIELLGGEMVAQTGDRVSLGSDPLLATEKARWGFIVSGGPVGFRDLTIWEALPKEEGQKEADRLKRRLGVE